MRYLSSNGQAEIEDDSDMLYDDAVYCPVPEPVEADLKRLVDQTDRDASSIWTPMTSATRASTPKRSMIALTQVSSISMLVRT